MCFSTARHQLIVCFECRNATITKNIITSEETHDSYVRKMREKFSLYFFLGFLWQIDKWIVYSFSLSSFQFQVRFLSDNVWWALIDDLSKIISALFLFLSLSLSLSFFMILCSCSLFRPYITFLFVIFLARQTLVCSLVMRIDKHAFKLRSNCKTLYQKKFDRHW